MRVSFSGNICFKPNTYLIKNQNGTEVKPAADADLEINTNKVSYVLQNGQGTDLHMPNGDVITANPPFNTSMYKIAEQLDASKTLSYDSEGKISIYDSSIDKLREALQANLTPSSASVNNPPAAEEEAQPIPVVETQAAQETTDRPSWAKSTYTLNGIEYNVVGMHGFNNLDEFHSFIVEKGFTNRGIGGHDWPGQCHNFSCEYGDMMIGSSKVDINSPDAAKQVTRGKDRQFQNVVCATNDAALQLMRGELESGRPCVIRIKKPGITENHYGLACGIRKDADLDNLKNTDFLFIDSYDGEIGQLNGKKPNGKDYRELSGFKNSVNIWQGKDYNFEYRNQGSCAKKYKSADEVKAFYGLA